MTDKLLLLGVLAVGGLVMGGFSIPMIQGRVPRNSFYGFRTAKTLASDEVWYPANRFAGVWLLRASVVMLAASLLILPFLGRLSTDGVSYLVLLVSIASLGFAVTQSFEYLRDL